jgi:hypothetical protein
VVTLKSIGISLVSLRIFVLVIPVLLTLAVMSSASMAGAQSIPLPPPFPENNPGVTKVAENDKTPPKIEILTTELHAGKNVFQVRITDDSSLLVRQVKYVQNGQLKIDGLFRDQNNVYRALIDIQPPARVVEVTAGDANGNTATTFMEYDIAKSQDVFNQIMNMLSQIPRYFQNLFGLH